MQEENPTLERQALDCPDELLRNTALTFGISVVATLYGDMEDRTLVVKHGGNDPVGG